MLMTAVGGAGHKPPGDSGSNPMSSHHPGHGILTDLLSLLGQRLMHPRAAVAPATALANLLDLGHQLLLSLAAHAHRPASPGVITGPADLQHLAADIDRIPAQGFLDE